MAADDLHCTVYVSTAAWLFARAELEDLLATSRGTNRLSDITGCLLYCDGNIMQALEGPADAVRGTFARIITNSMHKQITTLFDGPVATREFPTWSMAFDQPSADAFFQLRKAFEAEPATPSRAFGMLKQFWTNHN